MTFERRRDISILFGDPNRGMRMQYRAALRAEGFAQLHEFETLETFAELCRQAHPDLIFMDAAMPGGEPAQVIHALRHGEFAISPFVPVIIATWDASRPVVHRIIDCGADDVLLKPLSTQAISSRIQALADHRKPFVVTADYIGPDRRLSERPPAPGDPRLLVVPNPLRARLDGLPTNCDDFRQQVDAMRKQVDLLRQKAAAFRIAFVAAQLDMLTDGTDQHPEATEMLLNSLLQSAGDIRARLAGAAGRESELALCSQLVDLVGPAVASPVAWQQDGRNCAAAVQSVAAAILRAFHPERSASELADEVSAAVGRYRARQAALARGQLPAG